MEIHELDEKIQREIQRSQEQYEERKDDSYLSIVFAEKTKGLCALRERLSKGEAPRMLLDWLRLRIPELKEQLEQEQEHPSFSWYGEYYHCKCIEGCLDAYKIVAALLEEETGGRE